MADREGTFGEGYTGENRTDKIPDPQYVSTVSAFLNYFDRSAPNRGNRHKEVTSISYNASDPNKEYSKYGDVLWLEGLVQALNQCDIGVTCKNSGYYDLDMHNAVSAYQKKYLPKKTNLGVLDDETLSSILELAYSKCPTNVEDESTQESGTTTEVDPNDSPHYSTFFDERNSKQFRQNRRNIRIVFGNSGIVKELHDVIMRSVGVEVDTSGNPISETYEFIARDVTETDEERDIDNYAGNNGLSPSDIQYKFNFK